MSRYRKWISQIMFATLHLDELLIKLFKFQVLGRYFLSRFVYLKSNTQNFQRSLSLARSPSTYFDNFH